MFKIDHIIQWITGIFFLIFTELLMAQPVSLEPKTIAFFDSLDNRIAALQQQIPRLKQSHDISLFHIQREIDHSLFIKAYEEFVLEEDLFRAKDLVETRLERARFRKDQYSIDFYNRYKDKVYDQIKYQRMHYQALFEKEKNFRKEFFAMVKDETAEAYLRAQRMTDMAMKYAEENNFTETARSLKNYRIYTEARLFDIHSSYDLEEMTGNQKAFEKVFLPMIESDSLKVIKEADQLVDYCIQYAGFLHTPVTVDYFSQQKLAAATALADLLDRQGAGSDLGKLTSQAVLARLDSLNPRGVYKWHEYVVVIAEFSPSSGFENVKKGEAIINADNVLASYLLKNKLCKNKEELKFGYSYIIPYQSDNKTTSFIYHPGSQKWQYIACYTVINNRDYMREVSRYMPPLVFLGEEKLIPNP